MGGARPSLLIAALLGTLAAPAMAQVRAAPRTTPIPAPAEPDAIALGTGGVPGGAASETWFSYSAGRAVVRNVTRATLTPVLPDPARANGAAVIVAPGGGFRMLSMTDEGWSVARWLADRGIAAFVLKYRLLPVPADGSQGGAAPVSAAALRTPEEAIVDGQAALALVRSRATEWRVDPKRVGMLGFSAGAMTVLGTTLRATPETMPAFVAPIYPPMTKVDVPATAPPMFVSLAMDDPLFGGKGYGLVESWHAAGRPAELHVYQSGGHGYGLGRNGTAVAGWMEVFHRWLDFNGFLGAMAS